jgi:hypothetical protein
MILLFLLLPVCSPATDSPSGLPGLIKEALAIVPEIKPGQVVILSGESGLLPHLRSWGYTQAVANQTLKEIRSLAEFTIDHHFPIFVNATSLHVQRIVRSWTHGAFPGQAAHIMASDLYHEYLHARHAAGECAALKGQLHLLTRWRNEGILTIAGPYIAAKESAILKECH